MVGMKYVPERQNRKNGKRTILRKSRQAFYCSRPGLRRQAPASSNSKFNHAPGRADRMQGKVREFRRPPRHGRRRRTSVAAPPQRREGAGPPSCPRGVVMASVGTAALWLGAGPGAKDGGGGDTRLGRNGPHRLR